MSNQNNIPEPPKTPWAERFGQTGSLKFLNSVPQGSGLAPELPRTHPKFSKDILKSKAGRVSSNKNDLDSVYYGEDLQKMFSGLMTWEVAALQAWNSLTGEKVNPGGNDNLSKDTTYLDVPKKRYDAEKIQVDEDSWLGFFRKDHWYNPRTNDPASSVDDDVTWEHLRFVIELANRIMLQLIREKNDWIHGLLFGVVHLWNEVRFTEPYPGARVLLTPAKELELRERNNFHSSLPSINDEQPEDFIKEIEDLGRDLIFSLMEPGPTFVWGYMQPDVSTICNLSPSQIQSLRDGDPTISEMCLMYCNMAKTLCHELMHALWILRLRKGNRVSEGAQMTDDERAGYGSTEPFINFEYIHEVGESWENAVFGGRCSSGPTVEIPPPAANFIPLTMIVEDWLNWERMRSVFGTDDCSASRDQLDEIPLKREIKLLPSAYAYKLQSAKFWAGEGPKDFNTPNLFTCTKVKEPYNIENRMPDCELQENSPSFLFYEHTIYEWRDRHNEWTRRRKAWYKKERRIWAETPWSITGARRQIEEFTSGFADRNDAKCASAAHALVNYLPPCNKDYLPMAGLPEYKSYWMFHVIGLLMYAALPIRYTKKETHGHNKWVELVPGEEARAAGRTQQFRMQQPVAEGDYIASSRLQNNLTGESVQLKNHLDFLDVAREVIEHVEQSQYEMSGPWLKQILSTYHSLRREHQNRRGDLLSLLQWAEEWTFTIPVYNGPDDVRYIEGKPFDAPFDEKYR